MLRGRPVVAVHLSALRFARAAIDIESEPHQLAV
jgi:hypothetical protein